ncbi:methylated-DNA--[protein]-cysteine S-methyltransferase [Streptomyces microflavus]
MNNYGLGGEPTVEWSVVESGIGPLLLAATAAGLVSVAFHARPDVRDAALAQLRTRLGAEPVEAPGSARLAEPIRRLAAYFAGERQDFGLELDWSLTAEFHREVLRELASGVPYGTVVGYGELAARVGRPEGAQAVGAAMGANPCRWWCPATGWWRATAASGVRGRTGDEAAAAGAGGSASAAAVLGASGAAVPGTSGAAVPGHPKRAVPADAPSRCSGRRPERLVRFPDASAAGSPFGCVTPFA